MAAQRLATAAWGSWQQAARTAPLPANGIISAPSVVGSETAATTCSPGRRLRAVARQLRRGGLVRLDVTRRHPEPPRRPRPASNGPLQVFARFTDGAIWSLTAQPNGSWQGSQWTSLGGYATQGPGALAENNVFTVGAGGFLYHKWLDASGWHGWDTTTPLSLDAPYFDAEWTWMGSYATWRAAMMVLALPGKHPRPHAARPAAQTPGFTALINQCRAPRRSPPPRPASSPPAYDQYFRDVCSLEVTLPAIAPPVPPGLAAVPVRHRGELAAPPTGPATTRRPSRIRADLLERGPRPGRPAASSLARRPRLI